ncbi:MAG: putative DNA binding domain-containing protein [Sphaerochaeta sp.]|nr:putative DNA binding domain-containing protein [Sphaerochaeta sp.]
MNLIENMDTEFKELNRKDSSIPDSAIKSVVAFLNTQGGTLYFGIRDDGSICGVQDADDASTRLTNMVHDAILPNPIPFVRVQTVNLEDKHVIKAEISVGTERPYYLAKAGLKPSGVFMRSGNACIPINEAGIRNLIMETSGKSFEESRSLNQDLTFETLKQEMVLRQLEFGKSQMKTLKMIGEDKLYTNLAMLLSDQCNYSIKVAVFQGKTNVVFRDRKEFTGSILKQLSDVFEFLCKYNKIRASFKGLLRQDRMDYPEDAMREALLNSIVHRDYLFSGSTIINLFDDHLEFISLGGLVRGLSMEAIQMGVSQSRNPNLAAVFYRMRLVESYGTGVKKILMRYDGCHQSPVFRTAEGAFTVDLPNINEVEPSSKRADVASERKSEEKAILSFAKEKGSITRKEAEQLIGSRTTKTYQLLIKLCEEGLLKQDTQGKLTRYLWVPLVEESHHQ